MKTDGACTYHQPDRATHQAHWQAKAKQLAEHWYDGSQSPSLVREVIRHDWFQLLYSNQQLPVVQAYMALALVLELAQVHKDSMPSIFRLELAGVLEEIRGGQGDIGAYPDRPTRGRTWIELVDDIRVAHVEQALEALP